MIKLVASRENKPLNQQKSVKINIYLLIIYINPLMSSVQHLKPLIDGIDNDQLIMLPILHSCLRDSHFLV